MPLDLNTFQELNLIITDNNLIDNIKIILVLLVNISNYNLKVYIIFITIRQKYLD